jgi:hypothetical protein
VGGEDADDLASRAAVRDGQDVVGADGLLPGPDPPGALYDARRVDQHAVQVEQHRRNSFRHHGAVSLCADRLAPRHR